MDSVTQAVLGAGIQGALLGRVQGRRALLYGAVLATLPDLDIFVRYPDPVSLMTYHRGFSHSIFVLTALAAVISWLIRKRWPNAPYSGARLFLTLWLVLVTHPLLDALTVYGTQLFWPIPWTPLSGSAIFIIDPVYTLPLLVTVLVAMVAGPTLTLRRWLAGALVFSTSYLGFGMAGRLMAENRVRAELQAQGMEPIEVLATPMPFNTLLWRVLAKTPDGHYYENIVGWFDGSGSHERVQLPLNVGLAQALSGQPLFERLRWFTGDWLRLDAIGNALVVTDLRMGMPGHYTFRFKMAELAPDGGWIPITPQRWVGDRGGWPEMKQILSRIIHEQPPLPLPQWSTLATRQP